MIQYENPSIDNILNKGKKEFTFMSYGGGVQTFGMLLMIKEGLIPKPDYAVFSDTHAEKDLTYEHIQNVAIPIFNEIGLPFFIVDKEGGLINGYKRLNSIPTVFMRSCTKNYKIRPIDYFARNIAGLKPHQRAYPGLVANALIGISTDEKQRSQQKYGSYKWIKMKYPFIELDYSRRQIIDYIESKGYEVPVKSGCWLCPFQSLKNWAELKLSDRAKFDEAVEMEEAYFIKFPHMKMGFTNQMGIRLKTLQEMPTLYEFVETLPNDERTCGSSSSCFI